MKMKKGFFLALVAFLIVGAAFAQTDNLPTPSKLDEFYEKWGSIIWIILGALGVSGWLKYRLNKAEALIKTVRDAFEDGTITGPEAGAIGRAAIELIGKKPAA